MDRSKYVPLGMARTLKCPGLFKLTLPMTSYLCFCPYLRGLPVQLSFTTSSTLRSKCCLAGTSVD